MLRLAVVALALTCNGLHAQAGQAPLPPTQIIMLGTGTPEMSAERSGQSVAIVAGRYKEFYIFDAGAGVLHRVNEALRLLYPNRPAVWEPGMYGTFVKSLFITHLHIDHTLGLPELLFYHGTLRLPVFGPPGLQEMVRGIHAAWPKSAADSSRAISITEVTTGGVVFQDSNVTVTAFTVRHDGPGGNFGYRIQTHDRSIVLSGDTGPSDEVVKACNGCDVLIHEVYGANPKWTEKEHFLNGHTNAYQLGELATRAKPKLLILNHQVHHGVAADEILRQVESKYSGRVVWGKDLAVY
jgi:ribonuclease BN (tRNA processing enzyme)